MHVCTVLHYAIYYAVVGNHNFYIINVSDWFHNYLPLCAKIIIIIIIIMALFLYTCYIIIHYVYYTLSTIYDYIITIAFGVYRQLSDSACVRCVCKSN